FGTTAFTSISTITLSTRKQNHAGFSEIHYAGMVFRDSPFPHVRQRNHAGHLADPPQRECKNEDELVHACIPAETREGGRGWRHSLLPGTARHDPEETARGRARDFETRSCR